jgi:cell fate regulator YaaT (PSP1 superfamily)
MTEHRRLDVVGGAEATVRVEARIDPWLAFELDLADDEKPEEGAKLHNAAAVRLENGQVVEHDAGDSIYLAGAKVVCEARWDVTADVTSGVTSGVVVVASRRTVARGDLPRIWRAPSEDDRTAEAALRAREQSVYVAARRVALDLRLPLQIVRAEALSGGQSVVVYFASEERAPFRELLHELSKATEERVELRQVGMRDATKVVGGVGPCGLQLCCNTFLSDFAPITIKMAKDQGLGVNPQKLSGLCGRLLCCLVYEEAYYRAQRQLVPRVGERVMVDRGQGKVREVDVLQMRVKVVLDSGETVTRPVAEVSRREA